MSAAGVLGDDGKIADGGAAVVGVVDPGFDVGAWTDVDEVIDDGMYVPRAAAVHHERECNCDSG